MQHIKENLQYLKAVAYLPRRLVRQLLLHSNKAELTCIAEIAHNVLAQVLKLDPKDKESLKDHRVIIRNLADEKIRHKSKYSTKKVDAVSALLSAVLPRLEKELRKV